MKTLTIASLLALWTVLPLAAAPKEPKKEPEAPKVEKQKAGKNAEKKKPGGKPERKGGDKGLTGMNEAELRQHLSRVQAERKKVVTSVNESHEAHEQMQKDVKGKQEHLRKLNAEAAKMVQAIEHLKMKAAAVEKTHQLAHEKEEALTKKLAALEGELKRREQISALEQQAAELSRKAESLRQKAAELKKE